MNKLEIKIKYKKLIIYNFTEKMSAAMILERNLWFLVTLKWYKKKTNHLQASY